MKKTKRNGLSNKDRKRIQKALLKAACYCHQTPLPQRAAELLEAFELVETGRLTATDGLTASEWARRFPSVAGDAHISGAD